MSKPLSEIDIIVLAGGLGTRLHSVLPDQPKILAPIGDNRTYLDFLLSWLKSQGAKRVIFALGHKAEMVKDYLAQHPCGLDVVFSVEPYPLGTAGALRLAAEQVITAPCLVMNGDSWLDCDLNAFIDKHKAAASPLSFLCAHVQDISRYGSIEIASNGTIKAFREKDAARVPGDISAGIYLFSRRALNLLLENEGLSLEKEFFAQQLALGLHAFVSDGAFIDIGTPDSLREAPFVLKHA